VADAARDARASLLHLWEAALSAVHGGRAVERELRARDPGAGPFAVLSVGKAACAMAAGASRVLGSRISRGLVVTKQGHASAAGGLAILEAAHPVPDARSEIAAARALDLAASLESAEQLLVLMSGGASALWTAPVPGVSLADLARVTDLMLRAGADIEALNAVRRRLSRIKGGGLARAAGSHRVLTLALSDVRGDPPEAIGSGPTVESEDPPAAGWQAVDAAGIAGALPEPLVLALQTPPAGEAPGPASPSPAGAREYRIVGSLAHALAAARDTARENGLGVADLGACLYGEARELARDVARRVRAGGEGVDLLVAGGEPTVTVRGEGAGGRAQELALALALELEGEPFTALVAGTDGSDGPTDAAGAIVDGATTARIRAAGHDPHAALERNDSHAVLDAAGDLLRTGPTNTNVNDLLLVKLG